MWTEQINHWGRWFMTFAWPMLWQSSLLIGVVLAVDYLLARRIRASVRHALWLVVLVKLLVPPTLSVPGSVAWWFTLDRQMVVAAQPMVKSPAANFVVGDWVAAPGAEPAAPAPVVVPTLDRYGYALILAGGMSLFLLAWMLVRWGQVIGVVVTAVDGVAYQAALQKAWWAAGGQGEPTVRLKLVSGRLSPAVCGLWRPVILLPDTLAAELSPTQLRAVLLHELVHLRRADVWVNCAQALLQIAYWWHPVLWLANARIRRVREEAVDDAVMLALREEAAGYAPTLLQVAKLALRRPRLSLGLVGIMESRSALRQRVERLLDFQAPRRAGLSLGALAAILAFSAVAVPMGEAPSTIVEVPPPATSHTPAVAAATSAAMVTGTDTLVALPEVLTNLTVAVVPEVFSRNLMSQQSRVIKGEKNPLSPQAVLRGLLLSEEVDEISPHGLSYDVGAGTVTITNNPEQLERFQMVMAELNRQNGRCELPLLKRPKPRQQVLLMGRVVHLPESMAANLLRDFNLDDTAGKVQIIKADQWAKFLQQVTNPPAKTELTPRIVTTDGMPAQFFIGNDTNRFELDCKPRVIPGGVALDLRTLDVQPRGAALVTNQADGLLAVPQQAGVLWRLAPPGETGLSRFLMIQVETLTNDLVFRQRLQTIIQRTNAAPAALTNASVPPLAGETQQFLVSMYKVDSQAFLSALKNFEPTLNNLETDPVPLRQAAERKFWAGMGIQLDEAQGKTIQYNSHGSMLIARLPKADQQLLERTILSLNAVPPQIHIKTRFFQVPAGLSLHLPVENNATSPGTPVAGLSGILDRTELNQVLHRIQSNGAVKYLGEPEITTASGRACLTFMGSTVTVITNFAYQAGASNQPGAIVPQFGFFEVGPTAGFVPTVAADNDTIKLDLNLTIREFLGYAEPPEVPKVVQHENRVQLPTILPHFNERKLATKLELADGQTALLLGMREQQVTLDRVPVLASVPLMGRYFRSQHTNETEIITLVTVDLVDAAGNRLHPMTAANRH